MWFRKSSPRRQAIREDVVEAESLVRPPQRFFGPLAAIPLAFFILATLMVYFPRESLPYRVGDRPPVPLRARAAFTVDDPDQPAALVRQAERLRSPTVFTRNEAALQQVKLRLLNWQISASGKTPTAAMKEQYPELTDEAIDTLRTMPKHDFADEVDGLLSALRSRYPLIRREVTSRINAAADGVVLSAGEKFRPDEPGILVPQKNIIVLQTDHPLELQRLKEIAGAAMPNQLVKPVVEVLRNLDQATYEYSEPLTRALAEHRAVTARVLTRTFEPDQVIVQTGHEITPAEYQLLLEAQQAYERTLARERPWAYVGSRLGQAAVVAVLTLAGLLYASRMNRQSISARRGWALCGLLLLTLFIAKNATALLPHWVYMVGIAPTLLATVIMIIAFNQRFALAMAAIHALLVTVAIGQSFDFFLVILSGIAIFAFGLSEIRTISRPFEIGVFAGIGLGISVWALGFARAIGSVWSPYWLATTDTSTLAINSLWAAGSGVLVGLITFGIVTFVERIFSVTTSATLLQYCDANQPLLRRLAQEAPGTFNHSLTVGIMAETAAEAIGVNGLLCRAGAYYHDIGKLSKPHYFIENQAAGGANRHEKLSPAMSLLIIVGHVKDGVELAREYALPTVLHQFIAQHHGTTLVEYFFHAARKRQEAEGEDATEVREAEFRYPGPKPQTKEAAILMICDGVESMVRGLPEQTPGKIESAVHNLVTRRLMDGQFSECDLTLRELSAIEIAVTRALAGIYHGRVAYPQPTLASTAG